jgi:pyruvate dehydrogenase complex dehydrogenase (E1) component
MAMEKLRQIIGVPISDEQLMYLLRDDFDTADPGYVYNHEARELGYHPDLQEHLKRESYLELPPYEGDLNDLQEIIQQNQGGLFKAYTP